MASLMDMRELGMLRNATQRMESGGGIDMDEWRRRKAAEEQSAAEQAIALAQADPRYQALISGASGGPAAVGSIGNVVKSLPFLRHGVPIARVAKSAAQAAKRVLWKPGTKPHIPASGKTVPGTSGRPSGTAITAIEAAALGGGGYVANRAGLLGASPEEEGPSIPNPKFIPQAGRGGLPSTPEPVFSPEVLAEARAGVGAQQGIPARQHEGMPTTAFVPSAEDKEKLTIAPANTPEETPQNTPSLWETWGSLADNPKERKKAYLSSLKNIFMKRLLLDGIAQLTGGKSQGTAWSNAAVAELDAMEKFDSEERLHKQWKALFFREDGIYDPPKNRKEAMERGGKLGYSPSQMKDILSIFPKAKSDTPLQQTVEYILSLPDGPTKTSLMIKHGLMDDPKEETEYAPGALEKNIEYLKKEFDFSDETIKKIIEMQVGLRAKAGTARDSKLQEYLYNIWRVEGQAAGGGVKKTHASFAIWLQSPAGQATIRALEGGQSSSNVLSEDEILWGDTSS